MELNISEIDNADTSKYNHNYWNPEQTPRTVTEPKRFSYDDILSSLNMVVENGVLKSIQLKPQHPINKQSPAQQPQLQQPQIQKQQPRQLTPQERNQLILHHRARQALEQRRAAQAKPIQMIHGRNVNPANKLGRMNIDR